MPQMKPLNWLYLFVYFSLIMTLMNLLNYYSFYIKTPNMKINKNTTLSSTQWKW